MRRLVVGLVMLLPACSGSPTAPFELDIYGFGPFCSGHLTAEIARIEIEVDEEAHVRIPEIAPIDMKGDLYPAECPSLDGARFETYYWYPTSLVGVAVESCNCEVLSSGRLRMHDPMSLELRITGLAPGRELLTVVGATYDADQQPAPPDGVLGSHRVWIAVRP